ncbi:MAG: DUF2199 domain-containing protein [Deltaproteobacteria bacterium]|nr:DUF2199 domain-containing protein [Deltaproteobacteria bacterium]
MSEYEIELAEPSCEHCECCGGLDVRLTRFVERRGEAFAIYYAAYTNRHESQKIAMLVSLGDWGEESPPDQRVAFFCEVRLGDDGYEVSLRDAATSVWSDVKLVGAKLSREEALGHPWKGVAFAVLDAAFEQDPPLRGFLDRVRCGDTSTPLERSFEAPDDVWSLGAERSARSELSRCFASLDGARFFVRCLLDIPVEGYGTWHVGLWVETSEADHRRARDAWEDPAAFSGLRFRGTIANDLAADLGLRLAGRQAVEVVVSDPESLPRVAAPGRGDLAELLASPWERTDFERFAVARGFL